MSTKKLLLAFVFAFSFQQEILSQFGFSHEVGIINGPVTFYSDYGVRNDVETNLGNVGYGVGLIHYINFSYRADCNCYSRDTYFNDHFKLRNEIDYHKTNFDHFGIWVDPDRTSIFADQLRAMKGSSTVFDIGSQLEYFPLSIRRFSATPGSFAPFISFGVHWVHWDPRAYSELGALNTPATTSGGNWKYLNAFQNEPDSTWSVVWSFGIRYKLSYMSDLMLDGRWQYYFSNWVDGLNPSIKNNGQTPVPENKANDWIYWLNFGYIYYIN